MRWQWAEDHGITWFVSGKEQVEFGTEGPPCDPAKCWGLARHWPATSWRPWWLTRHIHGPGNVEYRDPVEWHRLVVSPRRSFVHDLLQEWSLPLAVVVVFGLVWSLAVVVIAGLSRWVW